MTTEISVMYGSEKVNIEHTRRHRTSVLHTGNIAKSMCCWNLIHVYIYGFKHVLDQIMLQKDEKSGNTISAILFSLYIVCNPIWPPKIVLHVACVA